MGAVATVVLGVLFALNTPAPPVPPGPATCDGGTGYYDPVYQICQPNMPSNPQQGYGRFCDGISHYDPIHGVCVPNQIPYAPPFYPNY